jgi:hypothetical protein
MGDAGGGAAGGVGAPGGGAVPPAGTISRVPSLGQKRASSG